ncbi:MAG: O-antigen ligase family protein [Bacilli bacterium]
MTNHKLSKQEKILLLTIMILPMSPYLLSITGYVALGILILIKGNVKALFTKLKINLVLVIFSIYLMITSLIFSNYLGLVVAIGIGLLVLNMSYYQSYITKPIFNKGLDLILFLSIIAGIYALGEQFYFYKTIKGMKSFIDVQNKPQFRIKSFFFNANYYAMMLNFIVVIALYRFNTTTMKRWIYPLIIAFNLFLMYLTGGRIALLVFVCSTIIYYIVIGNKKTLLILGLFFLGGLIIFIIKPDILPRFSIVGFKLGRRQEIYRTALLMASNNWLLGHGPLTYLNEHAQYLSEYIKIYGTSNLNKLGIATQHAHNMVLESIISFGLIGSSLLYSYFIVYIVRLIKGIKKRLYQRNDIALITASFSIVILSSIVDFSIFWIQTYMIFIIIITGLFKNETN